MNIYHRIYKLHQKNISPQQIAATTNMPLKSVKSIIRKLSLDPTEKDPKKEKRAETEEELTPYLDSHITRQHTHVTIDFSGFFTKEFIPQLLKTIDQLTKRSGTPQIVLKVTDIYEADAETLTALKRIAKGLRKSGRNIILFSPSDRIEKQIEAAHVEDTITIIGTKAAFDKYIYTLSSKA
ncbi:STAS domain-containing protein [Chitinivibrio alkaliphilus]|uniref:STAS domain-containing protein n=1 Tax=Chitinivibrio alkaliphilus ACht1 TaxID=1313304 RepID=U7D2I5_9BACT|nr:STAS domain-containing protein [Chitinivibrio alkaliphilus]ERP30714.1 hypothetical protein CALK_2457 [Chitinivibrio alkaliphilus ACht1]